MAVASCGVSGGVPDRKLASNRCRFWCRLALGITACCCSVVHTRSSGTGSWIKGYSLCCVSVRFAAKCLARILSPQRLPSATRAQALQI